MTSIYIQNGTTAEYVEARTNQTGTMDDILAVSPERGTAMAILNRVDRGQQKWGVPITQKLRDSNGDLLPTDTEYRLEVLPTGFNNPVVVSQELEDIQSYNSLSVTEQRDTDYIDATKIILQEPETQGGEVVPFVSWRGIDEFRVSVKSAKEIDWSQSELSFPSAAVKGPEQRGN